MARLTREQSVLFTSENLAILNGRGIETVPDFISTKSDLLSSYIQTSLEEIRKLKAEFMFYLSPTRTSANALFTQLMSCAASLPSGIPNLDNALGGGLLTGELVEVYGSSSCYKSQLCFFWATQAACLKHNVFYIDTKGDFSPSRIFEILQSSQRQPSQDLGYEALDRIKVLKLADPSRLLQVLDELSHVPEPNPRLIVIDNLTSVFLPVLGEEEKSEGLIQLNSCATALRRLAVTSHCAVLVINFQKAKESDVFDDGSSILGKYWSHVPHHRFYLTQIHPNGCTVSTTRSVSLPSGFLCTFQLPIPPVSHQ